jgi:2-dehydropantoate 2-reductase
MTRLSSYPWHISGVGAIGSLWASALTTNGARVCLLLKDETQLQRYQSAGGILLRDGEHDISIQPKAFRPTQDPGKIRHLLVCSKGYATLDAVRPWRQHLAHDAVILLLQNGMGSAQTLQRSLPNANIYCATSTDGAWRKGPFEVIRAGSGETLIGSFSDHLDSAKIPPAINALLDKLDQQPCLKLAWHTDIRTPLWHKLAINSVINALTAIYQCTNGELIQHPQAWPRLQQLCIETQDVMARVGIVPMGQGLLNTSRRVLQLTAANKSSMLQDCQAGRATEIDAINGYIIQQGALYHLPCAAHKQVCEDLRRICATLALQNSAQGSL